MVDVGGEGRVPPKDTYRPLPWLENSGLACWYMINERCTYKK